MARHFRSGLDEMIRQAELEEIEKKWREENERIMREHPLLDAIEHPAEPAALPAPEADPAADMIVEAAPAEALAETAPLAAENGTELQPSTPEANPPLVADLPVEPASEAAAKRARAPKAPPPTAPAEDENGPELPFDLPPRQ
jgi:sec-independent protein translocase protein TatB